MRKPKSKRPSVPVVPSVPAVPVETAEPVEPVQSVEPARKQVLWGVTLRIPLDEWLVKLSGEKALEVILAEALITAVQQTPAGFIEESAKRIKAELERRAPILVVTGEKPEVGT